jgi:hypothetical protein
MACSGANFTLVFILLVQTCFSSQFKVGQLERGGGICLYMLENFVLSQLEEQELKFSYGVVQLRPSCLKRFQFFFESRELNFVGIKI